MENQPTQLDPEVVNLAKAVRQHESGGKFDMPGKSGEYGAYQFTEPTWNGYSKKYGINVPLKQATPEQQNEVAYKKMKEWKDKGHNVGEIASMWNAGEGRPNAYKENVVGTNKYGVHYDTPAYAKKVAEYYQELKSQGGVNTAEASTGEPEPPKKDFLDKAADVVNKIFPGKQVGQAIGTLAGYVASPNKENYDLSAPTPLQVAGDVAQGALSVGTGLGSVGAKSVGILGKTAPIMKVAKTGLGKVTQGVLTGGGIGLTEGIKEGLPATEVLKKGGEGALTGGLLTGAGLGISKIANVLPRWLIPFKMSNDVTNHAMTKKLGSPEKMLLQSESEIETLGKKLDKVLSSPKYEGVKVTGQDVYQRIAQELPDANLSPDELINEITKLSKLKKGLVQKLFSPEGLSLKEVHRLNSEIGRNTYKTVFDTPETKAGKQIGNKVYHAIGDAIKSIAKEDKVENVFEDLSKEYLLNNSINRFINKTGGKASLTLSDLVSFDVGGIPLLAGRRFMDNPSTQLKVAGFIKSAGSKTAKDAGRVIKSPVTKGLLTSDTD